mmetsp:Transcript_52527/g.94233  ORF Transcript_52527/g.94233 Transcript_52527/m.94233 type:complete len:92 (+) Transcript_52527:33-308(+)
MWDDSQVAFVLLRFSRLVKSEKHNIKFIFVLEKGPSDPHFSWRRAASAAALACSEAIAMAPGAAADSCAAAALACPAADCNTADSCRSCSA